MPEEEISKERIIKTGRMLEKAKNIAVIILIAFLVIPCVYTVKDSINTHNDYKNSVLVEAEVIEVLGYEKDEVVIKYGYQVKGKTYEATAICETIRVSSLETKKQSESAKKTAKKSLNTTLNRKQSGMISSLYPGCPDCYPDICSEPG